ncbi:unnamed protein product [Amoebophrya sp. A120]|nr:unnamed protein product [Amoebophrya sp. A120]|eukprot:GSA120T00016484001.1
MADKKPTKSSLKDSAAQASKMTRKLKGLPEEDEDDNSDPPTPRKEELKTSSLSGNLEQLMESDGEDISPEEEQRRQEEEARQQEIRDRAEAGKISKRFQQKLRSQVKGLKSRVMRQRLRSLKIREGLHLQIPRCGIKLLLVQEKMGHFTEYFVRAGYDVVDMYKKYTDVEIDFILNTVEKLNEITFEPDDRVTLYKLFRYRYFLAPGISKPLRKLDAIPRIALNKHSARAPDDADIDMKFLESDRKRQVKRVPMFDEQAGMRMVQLERYDRELDLVYEIKDIQVCALEFEHYDPKSLLKRDPREEVLLRRMHRADRNVLRRLDFVATRDDRRKKVLENLRYGRIIYFYMFLMILFMSLIANINTLGIAGAFTAMIETTSFVSALAMYLGFLFIYRIAFYFKEGLDTYKLRKMLFVVKRFRSRLLKFRDKTEKERLERFDNVLASIDEFFLQRGREQAEAEQRARDEALLQKTLSEGLTFDSWFEQKSKMLLLGGLRYVAASNKESEKVMPPPANYRPDFPDGDRDAKIMAKEQFYQNVTRGRLMPIQTIDNYPGGSLRAIQDTSRSPKRRIQDQDEDSNERSQLLDQSSSSLGASSQLSRSQLSQSGALGQSATSSQARTGSRTAAGSRSSKTQGPVQISQAPEAPFGQGSTAHVVNVNDPQRMRGLLGEAETLEQEVLSNFPPRAPLQGPNNTEFTLTSSQPMSSGAGGAASSSSGNNDVTGGGLSAASNTNQQSASVIDMTGVVPPPTTIGNVESSGGAAGSGSESAANRRSTSNTGGPPGNDPDDV